MLTADFKKFLQFFYANEIFIIFLFQLRNQSEEIINLQKELNNARVQIEELGGPIEPGSKLKGSVSSYICQIVFFIEIYIKCKIDD